MKVCSVFPTMFVVLAQVAQALAVTLASGLGAMLLVARKGQTSPSLGRVFSSINILILIVGRLIPVSLGNI